MYHDNGRQKNTKVSGITGINKTILDGTSLSPFLFTSQGEATILIFLIDYIKRNNHPKSLGKEIETSQSANKHENPYYTKY